MKFSTVFLLGIAAAAPGLALPSLVVPRDVNGGAVDALAAVDAAENVDAVDAVDAAENVDAVDAVEAVENVDAVEAAENVDAVDAVNAANAANAVNAVDAVKAVDAIENVDVVETVEAAEAAEAVEAFDAIDAIEAVEAAHKHHHGSNIVLDLPHKIMNNASVILDHVATRVFDISFAINRTVNHAPFHLTEDQAHDLAESIAPTLKRLHKVLVHARKAIKALGIKVVDHHHHHHEEDNDDGEEPHHHLLHHHHHHHESGEPSPLPHGTCPSSKCPHRPGPEPKEEHVEETAPQEEEEENDEKHHHHHHHIHHLLHNLFHGHHRDGKKKHHHHHLLPFHHHHPSLFHHDHDCHGACIIDKATLIIHEITGTAHHVIHTLGMHAVGEHIHPVLTAAEDFVHCLDGRVTDAAVAAEAENKEEVRGLRKKLKRKFRRLVGRVLRGAFRKLFRAYFGTSDSAMVAQDEAPVQENTNNDEENSD